LVQALSQDRQSLYHRALRRLPEAVTAVSGTARRTLGDCAKGEAISGGVRRARLSGGLGLERISGVAKCVWREIAARVEARFAIADANLHSGDKKRLG